MPKFIVYLVKFKDQIKYIGITSKPLIKREIEHKSQAFKRNSQYLIHRAMRKYPNQYQFEEFITCFDWNSACQMEKDLIQTFQTYVKTDGYNLTLGGEGNTGSYRSLEWRKKKSESQKLKKNMLGKHHTEETKRKISLTKTGISNISAKKPIIDNLGNIYNSTIDASKILNIKRTTIKESLRNNRPLRCGLQFFHIEVGHP